MRVLMIGNDKSVKGGITTVINQFKKHDFEKENIKMKFIPTYIEKNNITKIFFFIIAYIRIFFYLLFSRPTWVHIHMSYKGSFTRTYFIHKLCKFLNVKDLIHLHGSEFEKWYNECNEQKQDKIKEFFEQVTCTIVLGEKWKRFIIKIAPNCKVIILNNSVLISDKIVKQEENVINFLYMGVLIKRKGIMDLLQAIKNISEEDVLTKYKVAFNIGGTGSEYDNLLEFVNVNNLKKYVNFLGWIDDSKKSEILEKNHIFIFPSYNEGLPMAILEAMSYGMPIIATDVGSISEAVIDGKDGILIPARNVEKLSNAIKKIILNQDLRTKMGYYSKKLAIEKFDENKYFQKIIEIYIKY